MFVVNHSSSLLIPFAFGLAFYFDNTSINAIIIDALIDFF